MAIVAISLWTIIGTAAAADLTVEFNEACQRGNLAEILTLVSQGANPNASGQSLGYPLSLAIQRDDAQAVRKLLDAGANPNVAAKGCGPLVFSFNSSLVIVRELLKAGANPNCVWADTGNTGDQSKSTPLMAASAIRALREGEIRLYRDKPHSIELPSTNAPSSEDLIRTLIEYGAEPNRQDTFGRTALYYAIDSDDIAAVRALLDGSLNINIQVVPGTPDTKASIVRQGSTALLHVLSQNDSITPLQGGGIVSLLLERGADPNVRNYGKFYASCEAQLKPNCSLSGETPLTYAAERGNDFLAEALLKHGAKPNEPREDGKMPAQIASDRGHLETAELIARYSQKNH